MVFVNPMFKETINTLSAGWLEIRLARWFGKKSIVHDGLYQVTVADFNGKRYLMKFAEHKAD